MRIMDTYTGMVTLFQDSGYHFDKSLWQIYADNISPELSEKCIMDSSAYDFEKDVLPVLERAMRSKTETKRTHDSFVQITKGLKERFTGAFGVDLQADIVLYFGLCNGAGWVTKIDDRTAVLLGIEKIIELDWCDVDSMTGLQYHELGHVLHDTLGAVHAEAETGSEKSLWQLYREGFAMYSEQALLGDFAYYHQNKNGWLAWCKDNKRQLFHEYRRRVDTGESTQDFFGDWCSYQGHSDVGYFLGCELIKTLSAKYTLKELANLKTEDIYNALSLWE